MSLAQWKCVNLGNCSKADSQKEFQLAVGEHEPACEECGGVLLRIGKKPSVLPKLVLAVVVLCAIVAGIMFALGGGKHSENKRSGGSVKPVVQMPLITSPATVNVRIGQPIDHTVRVNDAAANVEVSGLPPWLRFDAVSKRLSGAPSSPGRVTLTVSARNTFGSDTQSLHISVAEKEIVGTKTVPEVLPARPSVVRRKVLVPISTPSAGCRSGLRE